MDVDSTKVGESHLLNKSHDLLIQLQPTTDSNKIKLSVVKDRKQANKQFVLNDERGNIQMEQSSKYLEIQPKLLTIDPNLVKINFTATEWLKLNDSQSQLYTPDFEQLAESLFLRVELLYGMTLLKRTNLDITPYNAQLDKYTMAFLLYKLYKNNLDIKHGRESDKFATSQDLHNKYPNLEEALQECTEFSGGYFTSNNFFSMIPSRWVGLADNALVFSYYFNIDLCPFSAENFPTLTQDGIEDLINLLTLSTYCHPSQEVLKMYEELNLPADELSSILLSLTQQEFETMTDIAPNFYWITHWSNDSLRPIMFQKIIEGTDDYEE